MKAKSHENVQGNASVNLGEFRTYALNLLCCEMQNGISGKFLFGAKVKGFTVPKIVISGHKSRNSNSDQELYTCTEPVWHAPPGHIPNSRLAGRNQ